MAYDPSQLLRPMTFITLKTPAEEADRIVAELHKMGAEDVQQYAMKKLGIRLLDDLVTVGVIDQRPSGTYGLSRRARRILNSVDSPRKGRATQRRGSARKGGK